MACPTCDHTMQNIRLEGIWWCPRCGTLKQSSRYIKATAKPALVERAHDLAIVAVDTQTKPYVNIRDEAVLMKSVTDVLECTQIEAEKDD